MNELHTGRWQKLLRSLGLKATTPSRRPQAASGQSMVEYALIGILVFLAIGTTILLTRGAIGNIFSNQVYNLLGQTTTPYPTPDSNQLNAYASAFITLQPQASPFQTNTPVAPTCDGSGAHARAVGLFAYTVTPPSTGFDDC